MAGYSGTPLIKKLGIQPGQRIAVLHRPEIPVAGLSDLPPDVSCHGTLRVRGDLDVIVSFFESRATLARRFAFEARRLTPSGGYWIAWPKKASGRSTDLDGNAVRTIGLEGGLVDNKVCALDDTWSGLRFVVRREHRPAWADGERTE